MPPSPNPPTRAQAAEVLRRGIDDIEFEPLGARGEARPGLQAKASLVARVPTGLSVSSAYSRRRPSTRPGCPFGGSPSARRGDWLPCEPEGSVKPHRAEEPSRALDSMRARPPDAADPRTKHHGID